MLARPAGVLAAQGYAINASGLVGGTVSIGMGRYMERAAVWDGTSSSIVRGLRDGSDAEMALLERKLREMSKG